MANVEEENFEGEEDKFDLTQEQKEEIMDYFAIFDKENTD